MAYITSSISEVLEDSHVESLQNANIWTTNDFLTSSLMEIKRATNIKFHILKEMHDSIMKRYATPSHNLNYLLEKSIAECKMCPTGLPELTAALDGGFQTQEIVEFSGESEAGKTEMCYLLCGEILSHFDDYHILYIASNSEFNHEKVAKYTRSKAGNRNLSDDDIFQALARVQIARPSKISELVHLLNTIVHADKRNAIKCIIIDSLSFIIQDDILDIKSADLDDADELEKFCALKGTSRLHQEKYGAGDLRKEIIDMYLNEVMRLLVNIALARNVIVVLTNSNPSLTTRKPWTNAIDHRVQLSRLPDYSKYKVENPRATVCRATIVKTIHNINKIGFSIPFAINDEGLFAIRT